MLVTLSGISMLVSSVQYWHAWAPMAVTGISLYVAGIVRLTLVGSFSPLTVYPVTVYAVLSVFASNVKPLIFMLVIQFILSEGWTP